MTPVPTEYLRRDWEFELTKRCDICPHSDILNLEVDKNLPPCRYCNITEGKYKMKAEK